MPEISIIIPTYNHKKTISDCLNSIFNQAFKDFEIIIVNDGSTDNTEELLNNYISKLSNENQKKITVISQPNKGAPAARNRGFQESTADFLFFCDADVKLKPNALALMLNTLKNHPEKSYAYSSFKFGWKIFKSQKFDAEKLKQVNYITTMSLIRREHFPGWDENLKKFQDWDLWLTMLEQGHTGIWIPEVLFSVIPNQKGISHWLPSFIYKVPWERFGWVPKEVTKYKAALKVIKEKHHLL
jgi:glycosyltransferase involved in cell wall biosynthesis